MSEPATVADSERFQKLLDPLSTDVPRLGNPAGLAGSTTKLTGLPAIAVGSVGVDTVFGGSGAEHATAAVDRIALLGEQLDRGEFDVIALGRALLADASWVAKSTTGRADEIIQFRR